MPGLLQLLHEHRPLLVLDAASARVQGGWLESAESGRWAAVEEEAGTGVFRCLEILQADPASAGAFVFCDGPGSILGIRTVAMAIRAWNVQHPRPVFAYHSLEIVAHAIGQKDLHVIADARRDTWHEAAIDLPLRRVRRDALAGRLALPAGFRAWSAPPADVATVPYSLGEIFPRIQNLDLFRACDAPDAFLHEEPGYVEWTPRIHRAP